MSGYPLLSLEPIQMEKVISKMKYRSYFRLQQTCKDLEEFIRTSKHITVHYDIRLRSVFGENKWSWKAINGPITFFITQEAAVFHGIRVREFYPSVGHTPGHHNGYESLYECLKSHRISAQELLIDAGVTEEQLLTLAAIIKPQGIKLKSKGNTLYESIFLCQTVREISHLTIDENSAPIATEKLLAKYPKISMFFLSDLRSLTVVRSVLQVVLSKYWRNLTEYRLEVQFDDWKTFSTEELKEQLFGLKFVAVGATSNPSGMIEMPPYYPKGSTCHIETNLGLFRLHVKIPVAIVK